jgi:ABC-2 type transport system ATP-binding protein
LTTHHLEEAQDRCQRVLVIDHGRIAAAGTVAELVVQTLGQSRTLELMLAGPLSPSAPLPAGVTVSPDGATLRTPVGDADVDRDVARLAAIASAAGVTVRDITVSRASLQDVFIALTGRELRE